MLPNCPHDDPFPILLLRVCKMGKWDSNGPFALLLTIYGGGSYTISEGTKEEMRKLHDILRKRIKQSCIWDTTEILADKLKQLIK